MLKQVETSRAVAETVALCRPEVVCAYPITPQTHIVEGLAELVKAGDLANCEFINVESEFAALSVAIGASAAGARAYTATASQGLLFMAEAVYNASGLGLPIVMTIGNRAIGAPINIWNDHSDSMSMRDSGWIQLYAETAQEAADIHVLAFRIAEKLACPVMVCIDGFVLTHSYEAVDVPEQSAVDAFLPPFDPRMILDPSEPVTIGAMVGPEAFMEVRYLQHHNLRRALGVIPSLSRAFHLQFDRECGGLVRGYRTEGAETVVVALGSVNGTIKDVIDEMREEGSSIGSLNVCCYRPFPFSAVRAALGSARRVLVLEKNLAPGVGGVVSTDIQMAMAGVKVRIMTAIAGLGGRPITKASLRELFDRAERSTLEGLTFMDLNAQTIQRHLAQQNHRLRVEARMVAEPAADKLITEEGDEVCLPNL
jgi:pyruvate ferredoxin oxidoreductase alpha subunit